MATKDFAEARREAIKSAQLAVRLFAREPNVDHEQAVNQAWARVRMLDELRLRRLQPAHDRQR